MVTRSGGPQVTQQVIFFGPDQDFNRVLNLRYWLF